MRNFYYWHLHFLVHLSVSFLKIDESNVGKYKEEDSLIWKYFMEISPNYDNVDIQKFQRNVMTKISSI